MRKRVADLKGPLFAPRSHFIFLTRNNTQSYGFLLPSLLLFLTPGQSPSSCQGKEEAPLRSEHSPHLPRISGPKWPHPGLRMCSLHPRMCAPACHVCVCAEGTGKCECVPFRAAEIVQGWEAGWGRGPALP